MFHNNKTKDLKSNLSLFKHKNKPLTVFFRHKSAAETLAHRQGAAADRLKYPTFKTNEFDPFDRKEVKTSLNNTIKRDRL